MRVTSKKIEYQDIAIVVTRRKTKSLRVAVHPPDGDVRVSVPDRISNACIHQFILERMDWIKAQRAYFLAQPQPNIPQLHTGDCLSYFGENLTLELVETNARTGVEHNVQAQGGNKLIIYVRPDAEFEEKNKLLSQWYRKQLKSYIPKLIAKWEPVVGVSINNWGVKRMKTRWGTCNIGDRRIWLNLELIKKPFICLEYVVVHEMTHLHERLHNQRFWNLVESFMPDWKKAEALLKHAADEKVR